MVSSGEPRASEPHLALSLVNSRMGKETPASQQALLYPLSVFYSRNRIAGPVAHAMEPDSLPSPFRSLLVHGGEMTSALEAYTGARIAIRVLSRHITRSYSRQVLIVRESDGCPIGIAAIRVRLSLVEPGIAAEILAEQRPFGRIMRETGSGVYGSCPEAFFEAEPNEELQGFFWQSNSRKMYGRRGALVWNGVKIGQVVEILGADIARMGTGVPDLGDRSPALRESPLVAESVRPDLG